MSRDEFYAAVLTFLDQFIERGAAYDILRLRERLAADEQLRRQLEDQLPDASPSERDAFDAMHDFLRTQFDPAFDGEGPSLRDLLSWTLWERVNDRNQRDPSGTFERTHDPAQWEDWLESVERVRGTG